VPSGRSAARRTAHVSRTTAKGQRTREELVAAARRVFERDGYFGARVADITAEAGVAHGSFYTYFASRRDVFVAVMREVGEQFRVAVAVPPGEPRTGVRAALDRALCSMLSNFAYWWLVGGDNYDAETAAATLTTIWARAVGLRERPEQPPAV